MDLSGAVMSGYRVYEYMIVLNPHEELQNRIVGIINDFNKEFNPTVRLGGKPNLLLAQFFGYEMREERIINRYFVYLLDPIRGSANFIIEPSGDSWEKIDSSASWIDDEILNPIIDEIDIRRIKGHLRL